MARLIETVRRVEAALKPVVAETASMSEMERWCDIANTAKLRGDYRTSNAIFALLVHHGGTRLKYGITAELTMGDEVRELPTPETVTVADRDGAMFYDFAWVCIPGTFKIVSIPVPLVSMEALPLFLDDEAYLHDGYDNDTSHSQYSTSFCPTDRIAWFELGLPIPRWVLDEEKRLRLFRRGPTHMNGTRCARKPRAIVCPLLGSGRKLKQVKAKGYYKYDFRDLTRQLVREFGDIKVFQCHISKPLPSACTGDGRGCLSKHFAVREYLGCYDAPVSEITSHSNLLPFIGAKGSWSAGYTLSQVAPLADEVKTTIVVIQMMWRGGFKKAYAYVMRPNLD